MSKFEDFIVEIGTEELPPKDLQNLANSFATSLQQQLADAGINFGAVSIFTTPRRLAVMIKELAPQQPEQSISKRGPALAAAFNPDGTPTKAALGFAHSCGVEMEDLTKQETDKGAWLFFAQTVAGQKTDLLLPSMIEKSLTQLPVKKYMRWGLGEVAFVRPIHWILMLHGSKVVPTKIWGITSDYLSWGHRIHSPKPIRINTPASYEQQLESEGKVTVDFAKRQQSILQQIETIAKQENATPVIDSDLLTLVTGLVEHPVALLATFQEDFLRVPKECLISAMQDHQKCFALLDANGKLLPKFILISNLSSTDPQTVIRGNELVMHARLADAAFHFDNDKRTSLASRTEKLKTIVYQQKLGSLYDKVMRIEKLAEQLAPSVGAELAITKRAAFLCKADLLTNMVYEFPELQGIMGYYYALYSDEPEAAAIAIKEHYLPKFAQDALPSTPAGIALALADRIDTLVGLFGIGNIPTGEKDPYALRRQALAVLRILIEKNIDLDLQAIFAQAAANYGGKIADAVPLLVDFCLERLKSLYLNDGIPAKTFAAVAANNITNPADFHKRLQAVNEFQQLEAASSLAAANKRVQNLLDKTSLINLHDFPKVDPKLMTTEEEQALYDALLNKESELIPLFNKADYAAILRTLATLQSPVDNFFTNVMVMVDDDKVRINRLNLLQRLRNLFLQVADVSLL